MGQSSEEIDSEGLNIELKSLHDFEEELELDLIVDFFNTWRELLEKEDDEKVKSRQAQKKKTFGSQDKRELGRKNTVVLSDLEAFMGSVDKIDSSSESDVESETSSQ